MDNDEVHVTVRSLLAAAGLTMSDEEFAGLVRVYPDLRAQADALYEIEFRDELPALVFDPSRIPDRTSITD